MANTKPFVAAACICEKVLQEGNVPSLIRIVDTYHLTIPKGLPDDAVPVLPLTAFVYIKSGDLVGSYELAIVLRSPSGKSGQKKKWPVVLQGGEHGAMVTMNFNIAKPELEGLYWLDVLWEHDEVLTSIPFKLRPRQSVEDSTAPALQSKAH